MLLRNSPSCCDDDHILLAFTQLIWHCIAELLNPFQTFLSHFSPIGIMPENLVYHLYYFDARGWAEPIRYILAYAGVEWEDHRSPVDKIPSTVPPAIKSRALFGQLPMLEFGESRLVQSQTITRFLGQKFDLGGNDELENAKCDQVADGARDFNLLWSPAFYAKDDEQRAIIRAGALEKAKERYLPLFSTLVEANGGHLVGGKLTWPDIYLAHFLDNVRTVHRSDLLNDFPVLQNFVQRILNTSGIREYIEERVPTKL